jgi:superfamily II DNA or RNA helicase
MFYQPSASRAVLREWVAEILDGITPESINRPPLDTLTASEILDLTYLEGGALVDAIAAHALYPVNLEQDEAYRVFGVTSSMEVSFPVSVEENKWDYTIDLRAGIPSMLTVGEGGWYPRVTPKSDPPPEMLSPVIGGTIFNIQEAGGSRLLTLAGPMEKIDESYSHHVTSESDTYTKKIIFPAAEYTYAYVDEKGKLHLRPSRSGLIPLTSLPKQIKSFYLRQRRNTCELELEVSCKQTSPDLALVRVIIKNVSQLPEDRAVDTYLSALVLPHLRIRLSGARALFPTQQYAAAKRQVLELSPDEMHEEAERRLYQIKQSGCIATLDPRDSSQVWMTTFGVFDTPLEIPVPGPLVTEVTSSPKSLIKILQTTDEETVSFVENNWGTIRAILLAAAEAFRVERFHLFQWEAIAKGFELEATGRQRAVTIVSAPTGTGKTVVFMVNAAISSLCGDRPSTAALLFPTRILNEDMFRRLTAFVYRIRENLPGRGVTGGLLMGTSDSLYKLLLNPDEGDVMYHYGECPACRSPRLIARPSGGGSRLLPTCPDCGHVVDYMYDPRDSSTYLPDLLIATPDMLFRDATCKSFENYRYGLFGAPVRRCKVCNRAYPDAGFKLKPAKATCHQIFPTSSASCSGTFDEEVISKPIRYIGFDEVHSLYGETATYLSVFLATLEAMQRLLSGENKLSIRFEAATATIANETNLLEAITRRYDSQDEIISIPPNDKIADYFTIDEGTIRHRALITMPSRVHSRMAFIRAALNIYLHLRERASDLKDELRRVWTRPDDWDFLLGYIFRKQEGWDLRRVLSDFYHNRFGGSLDIEFLSGEAPKNEISRILQRAVGGELDILLANMVISLGIDIHGLNHILMYGVPQGFTEYAQTAGRTGRGDSPGHISIVLMANSSRDVYLYRHFHAVLSDVAGYYDILPVRSTNLHCSEEVFGNVAKALISAMCMRKPEWAHPDGVSRVVGKSGERLRSGIGRLLCDDPDLMESTMEIVDRLYERLMNDFQSQREFLGTFMETSEHQWLTGTLRSRSGSRIRVTCQDQPLLELMAESGEHLSDEIEDNSDEQE